MSEIDRKNVKAVVFDFDGVLTDNRVLVFADGMEAVYCNRSDGLGIQRIKDAGILTLILSSETNHVVQQRAKKLEVEVISGASNKIESLKVWLGLNALELSHVAYVGNDLNDLECIQQALLGVSVADAHEQIIRESDIQLTKCGGDGVAQELADWLLNKPT